MIKRFYFLSVVALAAQSVQPSSNPPTQFGMGDDPVDLMGFTGFLDQLDPEAFESSLGQLGSEAPESLLVQPELDQQNPKTSRASFFKPSKCPRLPYDKPGCSLETVIPGINEIGQFDLQTDERLWNHACMMHRAMEKFIRPQLKELVVIGDRYFSRYVPNDPVFISKRNQAIQKLMLAIPPLLTPEQVQAWLEQSDLAKATAFFQLRYDVSDFPIIAPDPSPEAFFDLADRIHSKLYQRETRSIQQVAHVCANDHRVKEMLRRHSAATAHIDNSRVRITLKRHPSAV